MTKRKTTETQDPRLPWEATFAKSLARARQDASMSQNELARRATESGLPLFQQQIQRIENLTRPVSLNEAVVLARVLHGDPWDMAAQMVDDATAWELLNAAHQAAEEAALRTIRALRDEYFRFNAAVHEAANRLDQFDKYRQERGPEKFNQEDLEAFRSRHSRLAATDRVLADALEQLTDPLDEPRLASLPADNQDA